MNETSAPQKPMRFTQLFALAFAIQAAAAHEARQEAFAAGVRRSNLTRVFLVPHSHQDPGWTQTIDEYYK